MPTNEFAELDHDYDAMEAKHKTMVLSILHAIQDLVEGATDDDQELSRADEICDALIGFAFKGRVTPLRSHEEARAAWLVTEAAAVDNGTPPGGGTAEVTR